MASTCGLGSLVGKGSLGAGGPNAASGPQMSARDLPVRAEITFVNSPQSTQKISGALDPGHDRVVAIAASVVVQLLDEVALLLTPDDRNPSIEKTVGSTVLIV